MIRPKEHHEHPLRILVLAPLGRDAALLYKALSSAGLESVICRDVADLRKKMAVEAGAVLVTQEALSVRTVAALHEHIATEPAWSDLHVVVLASEPWSGLKTLGQQRNVTVLERPTRSLTLLTVMREALQARKRQYQVRDLLEQQQDVNDELERRVQERTAELKTSNAWAETERQRINNILESITDAFIALDKTYRIIYLNQKGADIIEQFAGKAVSQVMGKTLAEAVPAWNTTPFEQAYRQAMHAPSKVQLEAFFPPLGTWFEVHAYPSAEGLSLYFHDTSERKEAEQTLRASEQRFEQAFRLGPMAASISTLEGGRFLDANRSFEVLTGYSHAEVIGRTNYELGLWASSEDSATIKAELGGGGYRNLNLQIRTKAGNLRDILASAEVMETAGSPSLLQMFYDITDQKRTEEELTEAIQMVMQDTAWFSRLVVERLSQVRTKRAGGVVDQTEVAELTPRERQVLERIAKGQSNELIAADLGLSEQTIRNYITRIYEKLAVHSRAEAVVWARERGLVGF